MSSSEPSLRGRTAECALLDELIAGVRPGACQVLVLRGEAGVGKTALLDYVAARTEKFRRIGVSGVESDMELAYAGVQQLCAPLLGHLDTLPTPQREALDVAFGLGVGETPDRFLVGLAVLSLLAAAAEEQPLVAVVDDAQWLDQVSLQTLAFVARRLLAEPVALLFAVRDHPELLAGLPELAVNGLSDDDARALLDSVMLARLDPRVRDRVIAETRGLPLAILEVPRSVSAAELSGGFWIAGKRSSPAAVEQTYVRRIRSLPESTQWLLLLAAAEPVGDAAVFLRAAGRMNIPIAELAPAEADGLIDFGARMRFHHPLIRSAAYRAADLLDRREAHRVLADATDPQTDPDRRAWHAAQAAAGPDDEIAAELERSAARAQSRGGVAAAATFLERAATLTADPALRGGRALAAAQAKSDAADDAAAHDMLTIAELGQLSPLQQALVARLRAQMQFVRSRSRENGAPAVAATAPLLLDAARTLERLDDSSSRESYLEAIAALVYAGRAADPAALTAAAEAALTAMSQVSGEMRPVDLLLQGLAERVTGGVGAGTDTLGRALAAMRAQADSDEVAVGRWLRAPGFLILQESAAHERWDRDAAQHLATAAVRHARSSGALSGLPRALAYRAGVHVLAGEFAAAEQLLGEAASIAAATSAAAPVRYHEVQLAAWRGDVAEATALIDGLRADAVLRGEGRLEGLLGYAAALLYNGQGRYQEAFTAARDGCAYEDLGLHRLCSLELIEAATRTDAVDAARDAVAWLEISSGAGESDWGLGVLAAARAMTSEGETADALFREAVERLGRTDVATHLARTRLQYGEWLRRANRRTDARRELTAAHDLFTGMGARGFAERTRRELVATGEKVRNPAARSGAELTAQEAQIAGLVAEGMTNSEIGAALFISAHTVEWHLRKVFAKLGISSRRQLRTTSFAP
ncbi:AAA family ATPase [Mycolicibacterium rufum]|uniref:AAA family ATPase n=1 Tax=Mycolicibacterium rufum TaxID=318424 RepID=A0ABY3UKB2_9MYCO|nr:LuxR family transcriptional regulator [Mycolicibacterium rufum]KGI68010.1 LuxR family transcriptional regulator [Mycolicibacterium rufum]ULP39012.1 AAA family ATPase [Mycolicibacterium rufum]